MKSSKLPLVLVGPIVVASMISCMWCELPQLAKNPLPRKNFPTSLSFPRDSSTSSGKRLRWALNNAAKDLNVDITFEGPETESKVDKQVEMFQAALDKKPAAICLAAVDFKGVRTLASKSQSSRHSRNRF